MAISNPMLSWFADLHARGAFAGLRSLLELGPQDLTLNKRILSDCLARIAGGPVSLAPYFDGDAPNPIGARALYRELGATEYFSLDLDDERADFRLDLNSVTALPRKFDIITNFGTAEHVFNIANVISFIHNHLEVGGLALHVMPTRGGYNHGFYNFQSTWYRDLAVANRYEIVDFVFMPDFVAQHLDMDAAASAGRPYHADFVVATGDEQAESDKRFTRAAFARLSLRQREPATNFDIMDCIFAALRKTVDAPFRIPQQAIYSSPIAELNPTDINVALETGQDTSAEATVSLPTPDKDDPEQPIQAAPPAAAQSPITVERLWSVYGKTRQRGLGWLMRRLVQSLSRLRSGPR